jgi:hypothetical protein
MATIPFYSKDAPDTVWSSFIGHLYGAYYNLISAAGRAAMQEVNDKFGTSIFFTMQASIKKKQGKMFQSAPWVPVNPYSEKWIKKHATELIKQSFTADQRKVVKRILEEGFKKGLRGPEVLRMIRDNIGLTERAYQAVENRRASMQQEKIPFDRVEELTDKYRNSLLMQRAVMISRTETILAENVGRVEAWKIAQDSGPIDNVEQVWVSAPEGPRTCEQCTALDGVATEIGGEFEPGVSVPTDTHPQCRCTLIIRTIGEEE